MGATLALEPLLGELTSDWPQVGGDHPVSFLHPFLPTTRGLDAPGDQTCLPAAPFTTGRAGETHPGFPSFRPGAGGSGAARPPGRAALLPAGAHTCRVRGFRASDSSPGPAGLPRVTLVVRLSWALYEGPETLCG